MYPYTHTDTHIIYTYTIDVNIYVCIKNNLYDVLRLRLCRFPYYKRLLFICREILYFCLRINLIIFKIERHIILLWTYTFYFYRSVTLEYLLQSSFNSSLYVVVELSKYFVYFFIC